MEISNICVCEFENFVWADRYYLIHWIIHINTHKHFLPFPSTRFFFFAFQTKRWLYLDNTAVDKIVTKMQRRHSLHGRNTICVRHEANTHHTQWKHTQQINVKRKPSWKLNCELWCENRLEFVWFVSQSFKATNIFRFFRVFCVCVHIVLYSIDSDRLIAANFMFAVMQFSSRCALRRMFCCRVVRTAVPDCRIEQENEFIVYRFDVCFG